MGFFADRAGTRMGARQQYRTMARMQRRRSMFQSSAGMHQDFQQRDNEPETQQSQDNNQSEPNYTAELQKLTQLKQQGILTEEEYSAKKKQILGI
jgi:hypothetical protein